MDDVAKKLFAQLDDDFPGVRANALDALRDHLKKSRQSFRDLLQQLHDAVPRPDYENALSVNRQQASNIAQLAAELARKKREAAAYRGVLAIKINWRPLVVLPLVPVALWFGYNWITTPVFPADGMRDLQRIAQRTVWVGDKFDRPFVTDISGTPYWVMLRGTVDDSSFVDRANNPVTMRCLHVFVGPAESSGGEYLKPHPNNWFGSMSWPERLVDCHTASS